MTTITIVPESTGKDGIIYRAKAGTLQSEGRSAGEALDALAKQLGETETSALVIIRQPAEEQTGWLSFESTFLQTVIENALKAMSGEAEAITTGIAQRSQPDGFFTAAQQQRLGDLMARWREARDQNKPLPFEEQAELEHLIEAELQATARRAELALAEHGK